MLVLQASQEQEQTFQKLIQTMGEQIAWEGRFIIIDNELILEGAVRSLFFRFETKEVLTNLIDIPIQDNQVLEVIRHPKLQDLVNMVLYAFGKWGALKGLRVEQDYPQLNQLFSKILSMYYIEPSLRKENFRFYKVGVRITYEEVLQTVIEFERKLEDDPRAESQGLWHRLIWKNRERPFQKVETTLLERTEDRIGNNFYLVGYQCPKCSEKLHMAVYPDGKEVRIDTEEKGVYLARAYTCNFCHSFYTPRPDRLIYEGLIYEMNFGEDERAYEDYLELLGRNAERAANFKYNEYEAVRKQRLQREAKEGVVETGRPGQSLDYFRGPKEALRQMEDFSKRFASLPDEVFKRFAHRVEEGFYPDAAVAKHEKQILEQEKIRNINVPVKDNENKSEESFSQQVSVGKDQLNHTQVQQTGEKSAVSYRIQDPASNQASDQVLGQTRIRSMEKGKTVQDTDSVDQTFSEKQQTGRMVLNDTRNYQHQSRYPDSEKSWNRNQDRDKTTVSAGHADEKLEKYHARLGVLSRLSDRQRTELKRQIQNDRSLSEDEKKELLVPITEAEWKERAAAIEKKVNGSPNRSYAQLKKTEKEIEQENIPEQMKRSFLNRIQEQGRQRGELEVRQILEKIPERLDRGGYQKLEQKLKTYEDVDMSPYTEVLRQKREGAEKQEIVNMVKRSRKISRGDYVDLMRRLEEQEFEDQTVAPYMEKIKEEVHKLDEKRLNELLDQAGQTDFNAAAAVYEQIEGENFLPELKGNALEMLYKRLEKIRTDECELLVNKLKEEMQGTIKENVRHHFYPARKVMLKTAEPEETRVIDTALTAYAADRSLFEYPIFTVDTSKNHSGREGMVLTPENLFYSTRLNRYAIPVSSIDSVQASTGLLNRKITLEETNGAKHKIPYAVKTGEMDDWAEILDDFIKYLQEKPASRKLTYLAKETHDTICCYRCGYVYHGRDVCPECGYKKNR